METWIEKPTETGDAIQSMLCAHGDQQRGKNKGEPVLARVFLLTARLSGAAE